MFSLFTKWFRWQEVKQSTIDENINSLIDSRIKKYLADKHSDEFLNELAVAVKKEESLRALVTDTPPDVDITKSQVLIDLKCIDIISIERNHNAKNETITEVVAVFYPSGKKKPGEPKTYKFNICIDAHNDLIDQYITGARCLIVNNCDYPKFKQSLTSQDTTVDNSDALDIPGTKYSPHDLSED